MSTVRENIVRFVGVDRLSNVASSSAASVERANDRMDRSMRGVSGQMDKVEKKADTSFQAWEKRGRAMDMAGRGIMMTGTLLTGLAGGMIAYMTNVSGSMEDALAGVRKVTDFTEKEYKTIDNLIMDMSQRIPVAYEEIAGTMEMVGRLGFGNTIEEMEMLSEVFLQMGVATNLSSEEAAEGMARFMNIMGRSSSEAADIADNLGSSMVHLGNNFAASEDEILAFSLRLAGAGNQVNMSEADIMALGATMASLGIRSEMGGTAMSKFITLLNTEFMSGSEAAEKWASITGSSMEELQAKIENGNMVEVLGEIMTGLDEMRESGENVDQFLRDMGIGEIRMLDTLKRLSSGHDMLAEAVTEANKAWEDGTALQEEADLRYGTFFASLIMFQNRMRNFAKVFGDVFREIFASFMQYMNPILDFLYDLTKAFVYTEDGAIRPLAKALGVLALAFTALFATMIPLGAAVMIFGQFVFLALAIGQSAVLVLSLVAAFSLLFVGITTLIGVAIIMGDEFDAMLDSIAETVPVLEPVIQAIKDFSDFIDEAVTILQAFFDGAYALDVALRLIRDAFFETFPGVERFLDNITDLDHVMGLLPNSIQGIIDKLISVASWFGESNTRLGFLTGGLGALYAVVKRSPLGIFISTLGLLATGFYNAYIESEDFREAVSEIGDALNDTVVPKLKDFVELLGESETAVIGTTGVLSALWFLFRRSPIGIVVSLLAGLVAGFVTAWQESETFRQYITNLGEYLDETFSPIIEAIVNYVKDDLPEAWENANKRIESIVDEVVSMATELKESWDSFAESFMEVYEEYFEPVVDWLIEKFIELKDQFVDAIESIREYWDEHGEAIKNGLVGLGEVLLAAIIIVAAIVVPIILGLLTVVNFVLSTIIMLWNNYVILMLGLVATFGHLMEGDWEAAWEQLKETAMEMLDILLDWIDAWFGDLIGTAKRKWDELRSVFTGDPLADNILSETDLATAEYKIQMFADGVVDSLDEVDQKFLRTAFAIDASTGEIIGVTEQAEESLVNNYDAISAAIEKAEIPLQSYSEEFVQSMGGVEESSTSARDKVLEDFESQKEAAEQAGESVASSAEKYTSSFEEMLESSGNLSFGIGEMAGSVGADFSLMDADVNEILESFGLLSTDGTANIEMLSTAIGIATGEIEADGALIEQFGIDTINALERANTEGSGHVSRLEETVGAKVGELKTHTAEFAPAEADLSDPLEKADSRGSSAMSEMDASVGQSIKSMLAVVGAVGVTTFIAITAFKLMQTSITGAMSTATSEIIQDFNNMTSRISSQSSVAKTNAVRNFEQMESGISSVMRRTQSNVSGSISSMNATIRSYYSAFYSSGSYLMGGFNNGMWSMNWRIQNTARSIANDAASTIRSALKIQSPSRVGEESGEYLWIGFNNGMENLRSRVVGTAQGIAEGVSNAINPSAGISGMMSGLSQQVSSDMRTSVSQSIEIHKQPAYISVDIGGQEFRTFSDNIYQENTKRANLRDSFRTRL